MANGQVVVPGFRIEDIKTADFLATQKFPSYPSAGELVAKEVWRMADTKFS